MELESVKSKFRFSSGKIWVSLEKRRLAKQNFIVQKMEKLLSDSVNTYRKCFFFSRYC